MKLALYSLFVGVLFASCALGQQQVFDQSKIVLSPFSYNEVKLQSGPLKKQFDQVEKYYLAISNDDLLKGFRERAGLPTNGAKDLGGWYSNDVFHVFGQLLGGMSRLYAVSGDEAMRQKVDALISEWAKTIDKDGYFFYSAKPNAKHYVYEKMVGGLVDAYVFTGNKQALQELGIITDWAIKNLGRERIYGQTQSEWYTLSENLYRAYAVTKDKKYLDFGKVWEYSDYWNSYLAGTPPIDSIRHHGYSHLNTLSGAAAAYLLTGDEHYKTTVKNAYNFFNDTQAFATGGFAPNERLLTKDKLIEALETTHNTFETQCGSWAIFKLSKYLMEITGDARYGDWIEKMTINGIGADIPMSEDGKVLYYSDYNPRQGQKRNYFLGWSCCTGTRPQAVAEYADLVYFKGPTGLYVNLFVPSAVSWNGLSVTQSTNYPEVNFTELTIKTGTAGKKMVLAFRKPSWAKDAPLIYVNGKITKSLLADNWLKVGRLWKNGDKVKVVFPMKLYSDRLDETKAYPAAVMYGPVAMAVNVQDAYPSDLISADKIAHGFTPVPTKKLNYEVSGYPGLTLKPYYQYAAEEPYILYVDTAVRNVIPERNLAFKGDWQKNKWAFFTKDTNASLSASFHGTGLIVSGIGYKNSGFMNIEVDGKLLDSVDTYSAKGPEAPFELSYKNLTSGAHRVNISASGQKNPLSKDSYINFLKFKAIE
ncbi:MAG: hypothetical protein K0S09_869 [Sphingobacteriaceae bacterium]|jgi:DUF1680 family protein|nr:hypothetical protein [Sphingobacteriaceae bacterium]